MAQNILVFEDQAPKGSLPSFEKSGNATRVKYVIAICVNRGQTGEQVKKKRKEREDKAWEQN